MESVWPWLAVAAVGALHGLNPAGGWLLAAAWGVQAHDRRFAWRALMPIALGHVVSVGLVAGAVALGAQLDRTWLQVLAGALLVGVGWRHLAGRGRARPRLPTGHLGLTLWSFIVSTGHGAGLMLVPALIPLCASGLPGRQATGSLAVAVAAVGVHSAAMLLVSGFVATVACRAVDSAAAGASRLSASRRRKRAPTVGSS